MVLIRRERQGRISTAKMLALRTARKTWPLTSASPTYSSSLMRVLAGDRRCKFVIFTDLLMYDWAIEFASYNFVNSQACA